MRSVRVGLVGSGYIAHYHARALQEVAGAGVQVVCSVDREQAEEFAKTYRIAEVVKDVNLLFGREDLQAVILCTPNALHAPHATVFLEQGKDVLIEKPMAMSRRG